MEEYTGKDSEMKNRRRKFYGHINGYGIDNTVLTKQQWLSLMKTEVRPKTDIVKGISTIKED